MGRMKRLTKKPRTRSTLSKSDARRRYQEMGGLAALEQISRDSAALDDDAFAIGPFARIDADEVAAWDGKTRGAITNLFGSQAAYQVEVMSIVLDAETSSELLGLPSPGAFERAEDWVDALFAGQSAEGPQHGAPPEMRYATLWALWLGAVPYGLWSERVAGPSMEEYKRRVEQFEKAFGEALARFDLRLRDEVSLSDLACAAASLIEGVWLNQCLTDSHPRRPDEPISAALMRSGRLLWHGAVAAPPMQQRRE